MAARRVVAGVRTGRRMPDLVPDTQLVVSELVGNAFQHAPGHETVEPELVRDDPDAVPSRWGVADHEGGEQVGAEIRRPADGTPGEDRA